MNKSYTVYGDMQAEKSSDAYPTKVLCEECVSDYEVVADEGVSSDDCEDCGEPA